MEVEIIVLNLLKNAVDAVSVFPESERSVWLKAKSISHAPCQGIAIEVTDNGPSLDDETFAKLCTPFNSSKKDGLGLGLYYRVPNRRKLRRKDRILKGTGKRNYRTG